MCTEEEKAFVIVNMVSMGHKFHTHTVVKDENVWIEEWQCSYCGMSYDEHRVCTGTMPEDDEGIYQARGSGRLVGVPERPYPCPGYWEEEV